MEPIFINGEISSVFLRKYRDKKWAKTVTEKNFVALMTDFFHDDYQN